MIYFSAQPQPHTHQPVPAQASAQMGRGSHLLVAFVERVRQRVLNVLLAVLLGLGGLELDGHLVLY